MSRSDDMPDAGQLVRAIDIPYPAKTAGTRQVPLVVFEDPAVRVSVTAVTHGRVMPAFAYRFDTADGSVVLSGDTTVNEDLIALAEGADILVHCVADLRSATDPTSEMRSPKPNGRNGPSVASVAKPLRAPMVCAGCSSASRVTLSFRSPARTRAARPPPGGVAAAPSRLGDVQLTPPR